MVPEARLDRIEEKVDKIAEAIMEMVRLEERLATHQATMERVNMRLDDLEQRVEAIEAKMPLLNLLLSGAGKIAFVILALITAAVLGLIFVP